MSSMQDTFQAMLTQLFSDEASAEQASVDYGQFVADNGYDGIDYTQVDMSEAVYEVSNELNIPAETQVAMLENAPVPTGPPAGAPAGSPQAAVPAAASASSGAGGSAGAASSGGAAAAATSGGAAPAEYVPQNVNHYLTQIYEDNSVINEFDQRVELEIDGDVHGDIELETNNVNAVGDGSVAAGDDIKDSAIATGDGALANTGDNTGQQNTGDGAVQVAGSNDGVINTGSNDGAIINGSVEGNVATGGSTINDQDVTSSGGGTAQGGVGNVNENVAVDTHGGDAVVGDGNQAVQGDDNNANFGSGDNYNVEDSQLTDSNLNFGSGTQQDNDTTIETHEKNETTLTNEDNDTTELTDNSAVSQVENIDQSINESLNDDSEDFDIKTDVEASDSTVSLEEIEIDD